MATVKICDRCGLIIKSTVDEQLVTLVHSGPRFLTPTSSKDLCTECMLKLYKWLRSKEEQDE